MPVSINRDYFMNQMVDIKHPKADNKEPFYHKPENILLTPKTHFQILNDNNQVIEFCTLWSILCDYFPELTKKGDNIMAKDKRIDNTAPYFYEKTTPNNYLLFITNGNCILPVAKNKCRQSYC